MTSRAVAILLTLVLAVVAAACGSSSTSTGAPAGGPLTIKQIWVRAAPAGADTAAYFTVVNGKVADDALVGVSSPAGASASIHETKTDNSGMTGMSMVPQVKIPGGGTVEFKPGCYHVMIMGLTSELKVGDRVELSLAFENAGIVKVSAEVRAS
jgi:copper(I)-binding protein